MQTSKDLTFGRFSLDNTNECLWHGQRAISLRPKASVVLTLLVKQPRQSVTKRQVLDSVWPGTFVPVSKRVKQLRSSCGQRQGDLVQLNFSPNPGFRPRTYEAEVFHAMQGSLLVEDKQQRLEQITDRLAREVKFGGSVLGDLDQGGTFQVKQVPVAPSYWELTLLNVHMKGKALFFKTIGVQQNYTRSNFKRVPDDLTLAKAAKMLEQRAVAQNQLKTSR